MSVTSKDKSVRCTSSSGPHESELVPMRQNFLQRGREERESLTQGPAAAVAPSVPCPSSVKTQRAARVYCQKGVQVFDVEIRLLSWGGYRVVRWLCCQEDPSKSGAGWEHRGSQTQQHLPGARPTAARSHVGYVRRSHLAALLLIAFLQPSSRRALPLCSGNTALTLPSPSK